MCLVSGYGDLSSCVRASVVHGRVVYVLDGELPRLHERQVRKATLPRPELPGPRPGLPHHLQQLKGDDADAHAHAHAHDARAA